MNKQIFKKNRVIAVMMLAAIFSFAFIWTNSSASERLSKSAEKKKSTADTQEQMFVYEPERKGGGEAQDDITLRAEKRGSPLVNLRDGKRFSTRFLGSSDSVQSFAAGQPQPLAMTDADLNADGVSDLIVGYANGEVGHLALYQGSLDTLSARTPEVFKDMQEGRFPAPFLSEARLIRLPAAPDFVGIGDFNRDGWKDIITAQRGDNRAILLAGNENGSYEILSLEMPGQVTALLTNNIDPLDNAADVAVAVTGNGGSALLVYKGMTNAFGEKPDVFPLPAPAASLAIGQLDNGDPMDILAVGGGNTVIIHGAYPDDSELSQTGRVEILIRDFDVASARVGNFVWDRENRPEIALLTADGMIRILERDNPDKRIFSEAELKARRFRYREEMAAQEAVRQLNHKPSQGEIVWGQWAETDSIKISAPLEAGRASSTSFFTSARMTPFGVEDLLVLDSASQKLHILLWNNDELKRGGESLALSASGERAAVTLDVEGTPAAILPMRLSVMNRPGIVLLDHASSEISYSFASPDAIFTVNTTADTYDGNCTAAAGGCSFRDALDDANANSNSDVIMLPAGIYTISPALGGPDQDTVIDPAAQQSGDWDVFYDTTITGAGQATTILEAAAAQPGHDRVLDAIQTGVGIPDLTISGVTIRNGRCRADFPCVDGGGIRYAVDNLTVLTMSDSTITNNRTEVSNANPANNGGGIFGGQSDFVFTNVTVTNNTTAFVASGCTGATQCGGEGGGIFASIRFTANPTSVAITNSTFTGNTANSVNGLGGRGGAYAGSPDSVSITGGTFNNNVAFTDGGAFRLFTPTTVNGSTISNNSARQSGGGIWSDPLANDNTPQTNTFTNLTMKGNTADSDGVVGTNTVTRGDGGAIFHGRGTLNINNPTIGGTGAGEANTAFDGGGIARTYSHFPAAVFNASTLNINSGGSIVGNQAINNGGGIVNDATKTAATGNASVLNMTGATAITFTNNKARNHGGGIAVITGAGSTTPAATATLNNMTLRSNQANSDNSGGGDGGALHHDSGGVTGGGTTFTGTLTIGGSVFANSAVNGGGIRNSAGTVTIPANASITFNSATGTGGGISNNGILSALATPTITNNTATGNGGGIFNSGTLGAITSPTLNNNFGATGGGLFSSSGALVITNGSVSSNVANSGKGGGIEHSGTSASTVSGVQINNNTGSGVHITGTGSLDVKTSTFTGNSGDGITKIGTGTGSHFDSNMIHSNGELGIDLSDNGVTPNDLNDTDTGPNNLQNFPVLNYVRRGDGVANVSFNAPNGKYRIQYYKNAACDASGHGEGEVLMASQVVDITSVATQTFFSPALAFDSGVREQITATATHDANGNNNFDDDGSTSEFSACRKVNTLPTIAPQAGVTRQKGSTVSNSPIATVADPDQSLNSLAVTVKVVGAMGAGGASATVNGITVSGISVDAGGNVTANIIADCNATNAAFTLRVTDNATEFSETTLNVTATDNSAPTVGNYSAATIVAGSSGSLVTPDAVPMDNGSIASVSASAPGFTGTFSGNTTTGAITINNASPAGIYTVTVTVTDNCGATTQKTFQLTVKALTTTTVGSSANPSVFGQTVTFTATVAPVSASGTPSGTVQFLNGGNPIADCLSVTLSGGQAQCAISAFSVGNHTITAQYSGDANFNSSTGALANNPQVVNKANTSISLVSSLNPSQLGVEVTFTAILSVTSPGMGTPTGTIQFLDGGVPITGCTSAAVSNGQAVCMTSALTAGNHTITAQYSGDGNFNISIGSLTGNPQVVIACSSAATVTSLNDSGAGTLRKEIADLCEAGTITFDLPGAGPHTITLISGELNIAKNMSINGPENESVTVSGGNNSRVFSVTAGGAVNISNLTVTGGKFTGGSGAGLRSDTATVTLRGMLFTGNTVVNGGGGAIGSLGGTVNIYNATISGNTATNGGGIHHDTAGTINVLNSTITGNTANGDTGSGPGGISSQGGGIFNGAGTVNIKNSIAALNTADSGANTSGTFTDQGNNILTGNPQIAALGNNGGPTQTHALLIGSPALDAGDNTAASNAGLTTDQRGAGFARTLDAADADTTATVDIGAFEARASIEDIADQMSNEDAVLSFNFNVGDGGVITGVTASSGNTTLVPNDPLNISITGSGSTRTLNITPAANLSGTSTITVTVNSGTESMQDTFMLTVNAVNDAPSFVKGADQMVNEDAGAQIVTGWATNIFAGPPDEAGQALAFNASVTGTTGNISFSAAPAIDAATGNLTYTAAPDSSGTATVSVTLSDNGSNTTPNVNTSAAQTFTITVNAVNDAPVLDNTGSMSLDAIDEDVADAGNNGTLISGVISSAGGDRITDVDADALEGIAVFAVDNTNGTWQFSTDNGANWVNFGSPAPANARLLASNPSTRVRFVPAANFNGVVGAGLSFRAWDQSTGMNGAAADVSTNGAATAFSVEAETAGVTVNAVNDAPSFTKGADQTKNEDAGAQTVTGWATSLSAGPPDEAGQTLSFNVSVMSTTGNLAFSNAPAIDAVTGNLTYTLAADTNGTATVSVTLSDDGSNTAPNANTSAPQTFTINVNPINDAPTFELSGNPPAIDEDAGSQSVSNFAGNFQPGPAAATDESSQTLVGYTVVQTGSTGNLTFASAPAISNSGTLAYTTSPNSSGTATFSVTATDSGSGSPPNVNTSAAQNFTITVNDANDAPVLDNSGNMSLNPIDEDVSATNNGGTLVKDVISSAGGDAITDIDNGALEGIAVFAVDGTNGGWEFSTDNGSNWTAFGAPNSGSARLLSSDAVTRVRFVPATNFNGTISSGLSFRAWDQTSGTNGGTADVSTNGGTTAFSTATDTASITVNPVNDAPAFVKGDDRLVLPGMPAQTVSGWATSISAGPPDESGQTLSFNVTNNNNALFAVQPTISPDGTLTFTPTGNLTGAATVTVTLSDNGGTANGGIDTSAPQTFLITVTAPPSISISNVRLTEGNIDSVQAVFTLTANGTVNFPIDVQYSTLDGTATAFGSDFNALFNKTVSFSVGQSSQTITVLVNSDVFKEPNETFFVNLNFASNATISDSQAAAVIVDDDRAYTGDFDLDRKTDFAVFRPSNGFWYVLESSGNAVNSLQFGSSTDIPAPGDYDGDGKADFAIFRPSNGTWTYLRSIDNSSVTVQWGTSGDKPVQADFDGDNKTDVAVFRPSDGNWYILLSSSNSFLTEHWGISTDKPVQGDYDGDGKADVAVWRESDGTWYVKLSANGNTVTQTFGQSGDRPLVADFDGDGSTDFTVYRGGAWYILESLFDNFRVVTFGLSNDIPAVGDYDGDGSADVAVFRPSNGDWYIVNSSNGLLTGIHWGQNNDVPIPASYQTP